MEKLAWDMHSSFQENFTKNHRLQTKCFITLGPGA